MRTETIKIFASLCESITEASTSMNLIANVPGGKEVIKHLHSKMELGHNLEYRPTEKISWSDLKSAYRGSWAILIGTDGAAAIKASSSGNYTAVASDGGEVKSLTSGRGGDVLDFIKKEVGRIQKTFIARNTSDVQDKKRKRQQSDVDAQVMNKDKLIVKFKPLWSKAIVAAIADIKGHVSNMIKNDAFDKARVKLNHIEHLQGYLDALEKGNDAPGFIDRAVSSAIYMAASYHYPDQTGNIERSRYSGGLSSQFSEGPNQLLKDLSAGDTKKLGTVLAFFKRSLITG